MSKKAIVLITAILVIAMVAVAWYGLSKPEDLELVNVYLFYSEDDKQSKRARVFLESYVNKYENVELIKYDVWNDEEALSKLNALRADIEIDDCAIPLMIIGNKGVIGYLSDGVTGEKYRGIIESCDSNCGQDLDEIDSVEFQFEPSVAPIERPEDENKEDDVC